LTKKLENLNIKPILLQDPFHTVPSNADLTKMDNGWVVQGKVRGELL